MSHFSVTSVSDDYPANPSCLLGHRSSLDLIKRSLLRVSLVEFTQSHLVPKATGIKSHFTVTSVYLSRLLDHRTSLGLIKRSLLRVSSYG